MYVFGDFDVPENATIVKVEDSQGGVTFVEFKIGNIRDYGGSLLLGDTHIPQPPGTVSLKIDNTNGNIYANVELPKGVHKFVKPEDCPPYTSFHPRSISLASCENDESATAIKFEAELDFALDFQELSKKPYCIESTPAALYHTHVLWLYAVTIDRIKENLYSISIVSPDTEITHSTREEEFTRGKNFSCELDAPPAERVQLIISGAKDALNFKPSENDYFVTSRNFTKQELLDLAVDGKLRMKLHMTIDRSYFSLRSIIDLDKPWPTVSEETKSIVATILRGGKPTGWDLELTGYIFDSGKSTSSVFYVHKAALVRNSEAFQAALIRGREVYNIKVDNGGKRLCLAGLKDDEIHSLIQIAYGMPVPLPKDVQARTKHGIMNYFFEKHFRKMVVPQWERAICRIAVALDKRDASASIKHLLRFLHLIWLSPTGWFPMAARIVAGVFADIVHLNARGSEELFLKEFVMTHVREMRIKHAIALRIVEALLMMLHATQRVRKTAIVAVDEDSEVKEDVSDEEGSESDSPPEKDTVEQVEERDEWYDVEAGDVGNQNKSCSIS